MPSDENAVEQIFAQAIDIASAEERATFIRKACGAKDALRREVERLVRGHFAAGEFLEDAGDKNDAEAREKTIIGESSTDDSELVAGRYRLLEPLGEGAFGVVYRAQQQSPVRRPVALKVLKSEANSREVIGRFDAERQALALMDHPHIARVFDAGTTGKGRPFFAMELVKGVPIVEYCDHCHLPTRDRLELFVKVCHAVQHAHQKGIIHRDLKPSNLLVAMVDGVPAPKVIDFGVAKAINQPLTGETIHTLFAQIVGTPLYMSPEQADMSPLEVDTRCDIYSLGVVLYELLTGTTPLTKQRLEELSFDEFRKVIRDEDPPRPSQRLSTLGNLTDTVAECRRTDPRRLLHLVRGELDWIVMKALDKDRSRRYETADAFARDITRYLNDEPVEASPPSTLYRARKFVHRNRTAIILAASALVAIISGLSVSTFLIAEQRDRAEQSAQREAAAASVAREAETQAKREREAARTAETQAQRERKAALAQRNLALDYLYFAHIQLAQHDWQAGQIKRMHEMLDAHTPKPDEPDFRGWEWYYLLSLCHRDLRTLTGHKSGVLAVCQSPDGRQLASGGADYSVRLWNADTGRETHLLAGHNNEIQTVAWSSKGQWLASGATDGLGAIIWDTQTGLKSRVLPYGDAVFALAWHPDGERLAVGGSWQQPDPDGKKTESSILIWNARTGEKLHTLLPENGQMIRSLAWSPDGKLLLAAENFNGQVRVWDAEQKKFVHAFKAHGHLIPSMAFNRDGSRFATASVDLAMKIWETGTWKTLVNAQEAHHGAVHGVCWKPDGSYVATAGEDGLLKIWNTTSDKPVSTIHGHQGSAMGLCWSVDGKQLASASLDGTLKQWAVATEHGPRSIPGQWFGSWNPDGRLVAVGAPTGKNDLTAIDVFDASTSEKLFRLADDPPSKICSVAWSPDGNSIAIGYKEPTAVGLWSVSARKPLWRKPAHVEELRTVAWSPDSRLIVSTGRDQAANVWDARSGKIERAFKAHKSPIGSAVFSPDGKRIASFGWLRETIIWEWETGKKVLDLQRPGGFQSDGQYSVAWSPRGDRLAAGCGDGQIMIWDLVTGLEVGRLTGHTSHVRSVSWSPDGKRIASGGFDRDLKVWDVESNRELLSLPGHSRYVNCVTWSPDGKRLMSADQYGVKIWDPQAAYAYLQTLKAP